MFRSGMNRVGRKSEYQPLSGMPRSLQLEDVTATRATGTTIRTAQWIPEQATSGGAVVSDEKTRPASTAVQALFFFIPGTYTVTLPAHRIVAHGKWYLISAHNTIAHSFNAMQASWTTPS